MILAAVVYFFVVLPYTKARERFFPSPEAGTPEDITLLAEIRDLLAARARSDRPRARLSRGAGGTCARSHASPGPRRTYARADSSGSCSSFVVSGSTSPKTAASRLRRSHAVSSSAGLAGHAQRPAASASAWASSGLSPDGDPLGEPEGEVVGLSEGLSEPGARPR